MIDIKFSQTPTDEELKKMLTLIERDVMSNLTTFWTKAVPIIAAETARIFVTQGYGGWQALSPNYTKWKARVRPLVTILRLTDKYFKAATQKGDPGNLIKKTRKKLTYGIDISAFDPPYPIFLEEGTAKMPARPVWSNLASSNALREKLVIALRDWTSKKVQKELKKVFS